MLKSLTQPQLINFLAEKHGGKHFHYKQLYAHLHRRRAAEFEMMSDLPAGFRQWLTEHARVDEIELRRSVEAADGTRKLIFGLDSGGEIESVIIPAHHSRR